MQVPSLARGKRFTLPRPTGSADALLLARLAQRGGLTAVVTAEPADAQRLADELLFFAPGLRVALFPDWETLPYDNFSPHQDLISERLATLWRLWSARDVDVVLLPATTALTRLAPPAFLAATTFQFKQKDRLDEAALKAQLTLAGYSHVSQVVSPGEYAVRGGLIDLFPMGSPVPYRVDLFGDEIDSIRTFDPDTQRSLYPVPEVRLLPGREFPMDDAARTTFRARWREKLEGDPTKSRIYKDIGAGIATAGIEYYLPLFFDADGDALRLPRRRRRRWCCTATSTRRSQRFWTDTRERHRFLQHDPERPILPPEEHVPPHRGVLHADAAARRAGAARRRARRVGAAAARHGGRPRRHRAARPARASPRRDAGTRADRAPRAKAGARACSTCCATTRSTVPSVATLAEFEASDEKVAIAAAPLAAGFHWQRDGGAAPIQFITETELFATAPSARRRRKQEQVSDVDALIKDLSELKVGDPVVHVNHGIGRYMGLINIDLGDGPSEFLHLEYADKATLYVPVSQLHLIGRYTGVSPEEAPLHKLGSGQWDKARSARPPSRCATPPPNC